MEKVFAVIFQISRFSRSNSRYRGYRGQFPDIAIATAKFPISRYRDDRELSVCLLRGLKFYSVVAHNVLNSVSKFGWPSTYRLRDIPPLSGMKYCTNSKRSKSYRNEGGLI